MVTRAAARPDRAALPPVAERLAVARRALVPTEHDSQCAVVAWAALLAPRYPGLDLLYAVPNGGYRSRRTAGRMKAEGAKAGVPDLHLPCARGPYIGLWVELKRERGGRLTHLQAWWIGRLEREGHRVEVCLGAEAAQSAILTYLNLT